MQKLATQVERSVTRTSRVCARGVVWIAIACALWQAPIPWWHVHSDDVTAHHDAARVLERHLRAYHARDDVESGHVHFVLLSDVARGAGTPVPCEEDEPDVNPTLVLLPRLAEEAGASRVAAPPTPLSAAAIGVALRPIAVCDRCRSHFLADFSQHQRLLPLLGVALC